MSESENTGPPSAANRDRFFAVATAALMILAVVYLGKGFSVTIRYSGGDLARRWIEQHYVIRGQNPYDVAYRDRALNRGEPMPETTRDATPAPDLGIPYDVDYPPWSYFSGMPMFWPPRRYVGAWYALWELIGMAVIGAWVYRNAGDCGRAARWFLVASVLAFGAFCTTIGTGNYGVLVLALLIVGYELAEAGRPVGAGLAVGVALLKPSLSGPFLLAHLVKRQVGLLAVAAGYLVVASGVVWGLTRTDPLEMTGQMLRFSRHSVGAGFGPLNAVLAAGVPHGAAVLVTAAAVVGLALAVMVVIRDQPLLTLYAVASVAARFWTYHLMHSNLILLFLLVALWRQAVARPRAASVVAFAAVAVTLWLPAKASELPAVALVQYLVWAAGLVVLLAGLEPAGRVGEVGVRDESSTQLAGAQAAGE